MATGTKASELQIDDSGVASAEHLLAVTNLGTARIPKYRFRPESEILFIIGSTTPTVEINDEEHFGRFLSINNTTSTVTFNLPSIDDAKPPVNGVSIGGLYAEFVVASGAQDVSFAVSDPNTLRGTGNSTALVAADQIFVGLSRELADEALVRLYKRGGLWVAECTQGWRSTSDGDDSRPITITSDQNREITDADHAQPIWLTNASPGTLTFQTDIAVGTQTTVINQGSNTVGIDYGSHTNVSGDLNIAAGQAASVIVGPTVSGTNRAIFVAASS